MKYIRFTGPLGNFAIGDEREMPNDVAEALVTEGKAIFIEKLSPPKNKVLHTLEEVVEQQRANAQRQEKELVGASLAKEPGVVAVKKK